MIISTRIIPLEDTGQPIFQLTGLQDTIYIVSTCNNGPSTSTGISKHFTMHGGCPNDLSREKETLSYTLIDHIDVTKEDLVKAGHVPGPKCRCQECSRLKDLEDQWIVRMGTFYGESGLNSRDEIQSKTRFNWSNN